MKNTFTILFLLISNLVSGQVQDSSILFSKLEKDTLPSIEVIAEYRDGEIFLRWAPSNSITWNNQITYGYRIERHQIDTITQLPIVDSKIEQVVLPWKLEQFRPYSDGSRKSLATAAEAMYGEWQSRESEGFNFAGQKQELDNRWGMSLFVADVDAEAAIALGLGWKDTNVKPNESYFYQVFPINPIDTIRNGYVSVQSVITPILLPEFSNIIEEEQNVILQWNRPYHEDYYTAYYIESSDNGVDFDRMNLAPFVGGVTEEFPSDVFSYSVNVANYVPAYYRIIGITPFGRLSPPSPAIKAMGRDRTPPSRPEIDLLTDEITGIVTVKWEDTEDVDYYIIGKSDDALKGFKPIKELPADQTIYKDTVSDVMSHLYYSVVAVDTAGNMNRSLPRLAAFRDTMAPESPINVTGKIDTSGVLTLKWKQNEELDFRGYHVYVANKETHMFNRINAEPLKNNSFSDTITLRTLTEEIFYKVVAVDFHGHHSEFSEMLSLKKPDLIPPFPPAIKRYEQNEDHLVLFWTPSKSHDVVNHILFKKENGSKEWEIVNDFIKENNQYADFDVKAGKRYSYQLIAIDDDGLESKKKDPLNLKFVDKSTPEDVVINECFYDKNEDVLITWTPSTDDAFKEYQIFRGTGEGRLEIIARIGSDNQYLDTKVRKGKTYNYAIKQVWKNGRKSSMSKKVIPEKSKLND